MTSPSTLSRWQMIPLALHFVITCIYLAYKYVLPTQDPCQIRRRWGAPVSVQWARNIPPSRQTLSGHLTYLPLSALILYCAPLPSHLIYVPGNQNLQVRIVNVQLRNIVRVVYWYKIQSSREYCLYLATFNTKTVCKKIVNNVVPRFWLLLSLAILCSRPFMSMRSVG